MADRSPSLPEARWEHFPHDADIGVRGCGPTLAAAFEQAALALTAVVTDPANIALRRSVGIVCEAPSAELLLVDWLNAVVLRMATDDLVFGAFEVAISGTRLDGPEVVKDVVYTMRFDKGSALYGEFGRFYVGYLAPISDVVVDARAG